MSSPDWPRWSASLWQTANPPDTLARLYAQDPAFAHLTTEFVPRLEHLTALLLAGTAATATTASCCRIRTGHPTAGRRSSPPTTSATSLSRRGCGPHSLASETGWSSSVPGPT
ncbi:hypothetical protein ACFC09_44190 [Streptomyces sp. NPDC056161]|uniref:hypothetical protein n=1 Tax=Streptomyces sp. NPDC056161 TaxID=3345732 RepID=UPI0035D7E56B